MCPFSRNGRYFEQPRESKDPHGCGSAGWRSTLFGGPSVPLGCEWRCRHCTGSYLSSSTAGPVPPPFPSFPLGVGLVCLSCFMSASAVPTAVQPLLGTCLWVVRDRSDLPIPMRGLLPRSLPAPNPYTPERSSGSICSSVCGGRRVRRLSSGRLNGSAGLTSCPGYHISRCPGMLQNQSLGSHKGV